VILEAIGLAATDIFDYNRENFQWDQELRFKKNETRLGMQIERFDLFREDIEDLVNLTVGKMDMYHSVGEIFLAFSLTLYTEGRLSDKSPFFYTSMYFFSTACAWIYILLAVWLAVYASITAHSFGVRIRTRYVRLPIPSLDYITRLTARLTDFEKQNVQDLMRVPFSTSEAPNWQYRGSPEPGSSSSFNAQRRPGPSSGPEAELLGPGIAALQGEHVMGAHAAHVDKHVQLYRQLQSKWQCFDAYARVCMAIGVNNLLQAVNFFVIGITLVNSRAPSCGYALTCIFQMCRLALGYLDIAGVNAGIVTLVQLTGTLPVIIVLVALTCQEDDTYTWGGVAASTAFFLMAVWFELLIWLARPADNEESIPRNYRTVLFLDVFGDDAYDPCELEHRHVTSEDAHTSGRQERESQAALVELALATGQSALRRWEAAPRKLLPDAQRQQLAQLRNEYSIWRKTYQGHSVRQKTARAVPANDTLSDGHDLRPWAELTAAEQEEDEFALAWVGPLQQGGAKLYFNPELNSESWELSAQQRLLQLEEVAAHVRFATDMVKGVMDGAGELSKDAGAGSEGAGRPKKPKVVRLPWKVVRFMSRAMQLMWLFLCVMQAAETWTGNNTNHMHSECLPWEPVCATESSDSEDGRRLHDAEGTLQTWGALSEVAVAWPHGGFFQPTGLFHVTGPLGSDSLLVSSPYLLYKTTSLDQRDMQMETLHGLTAPNAIPLCPPAELAAATIGGTESIPCLLGSLAHDRVALRPSGPGFEDAKTVELALPGRPWRLLAGAALHCSNVSGLLVHETSSEWCLLLVGWDGSRIPLAVVPLAAGPLHPPEPMEAITSRLDIPLLGPRTGAPDAMDDVVALHVEAPAGRLWAVLAGERLQAWDLLGPRSLGRWHMRLPASVDSNFGITAVCGGNDGTLWVAGTSEQGEPRLLRAVKPPELQIHGKAASASDMAGNRSAEPRTDASGVSGALLFGI